MNPSPNRPKDRKKIRRSTWMPALLLVYRMTVWFAPELIARGETARLIIVFLSEVFIIVLLRFFLLKRERQQGEE